MFMLEQPYIPALPHAKGLLHRQRLYRNRKYLPTHPLTLFSPRCLLGIIELTLSA